VKTYQYIDADNAVVAVFDEDGISRMSMLASALPEGAVVDPYVAPPPPIPATVTRFQALATLSAAGHLPAIRTYIATLDQDNITRLAWENAADWERSSPTLAALATMLGLTDAQVDDLFVAALQVSA
jgi:hypothetical protein